MIKRTLLFLAVGSVIYACTTAKKQINTSAGARTITEKPAQKAPMVVVPGTPVYGAATINYKRGGKELLHLQFNNPVVISVAAKPEKWGYFQFPNIGRQPDGKLITTWAMNNDAMEAYGTESGYSATSADEGNTWTVAPHRATVEATLLPNGDRIAINTPVPVDATGLKLPKPVGTSPENYRKSDFIFYRIKDLPVSSQGVFLKRWKKGGTGWQNEQDSLYDPNATRYVLAGKIPVVWWGDMRVAKDGSVIAGIYPGNMVRNDGSFDNKNNIFFYRSVDNGRSWHVQGRIMYQPDLANDPEGPKRMGLLEPGFEILKDGTFLCVIRTHDGVGMGPMYSSYSKDMGKTWTRPAVIAANGVLPRLLQLDNGVLVLASGRPGVQLRFCAGPKDENWTDPFEMLPYKDNNDQVSCGYTGLVPTGKNSFIIIYSDFNYKLADGNIRKAIKVREIIAEPK